MSTVLMYLEVVRLLMIFTVLSILPQVSEWSKYYLGPSEEGSVPAQLASALKLAHSGAPMKPSIHDPVTETLSLHKHSPAGALATSSIVMTPKMGHSWEQKSCSNQPQPGWQQQ